MIIDIHTHYTTEPAALHRFRDQQLAGLADPARGASADGLAALGITDEEIVQSVQPQMRLQRERGTDLSVFSPRAAGMAHHVGTEAVSQRWARICNDIIHRVCALLPERFVGVGQLPQFPGVSPAQCIEELEHMTHDLGFVGVNLNPDPSGGYWSGPPMTDRHWYPLYEKLVELEMPAMIHVSSSCNPNFHATGAHYINADTSVFMQLIQGNLFKDFPSLKFIIPHGGGAVPFHWGRYRGMCLAMRRLPLAEHLLKNVFFDTCVYHLPGIRLLTEVVPADNLLFASEMLGAVPDIDPDTGYAFDDTRRYLDDVKSLDAVTRYKIFEGNARRVYPRLNALLVQRGLPDVAPGMSEGARA